MAQQHQTTVFNSSCASSKQLIEAATATVASEMQAP
jgi:hypothetical protein